MGKRYLLLLLLSLPSIIWSQKAALTFSGNQPAWPDGFIKTYKGTIGKYPIVMKLTNWKDGTLSGSYYYTKVKKPIYLDGDFSDSEVFVVRETVNGETTGTFFGKFGVGGSITGHWRAAKGTSDLPFKLEEIVSPFDVYEWAGDWHLNGVWEHGTLLVGNVGKDSFEFALQFFRSGHVGYLEGKARYNGQEANYSHLDFGDEACELSFVKKEGQIELEQSSSNVACGFGMRAYAGGTYEAEVKNVQATLEYGHEEDPFTTKTQHDTFLKLVGQDFYDLFAFNMQVSGKVENKDPFEAKVVTGGALGLMTSNEAIIMTDNSGHVWAATLDFEGEDSLVRYFTNHPKYKKVLPASIKEWQEAFPSHYRLVFGK